MSSGNLLRTATVSFAALIALCVLSISHVEAKPIYFGIGTGLQRLNAEGDQGLHINTGNIGPVLVKDFELDPDDFSDLMESAFGFGGYVTDGTWIATFSLAQLKLGGDPSGELPALGATFDSEWSFDVLTGQLMVGYPAYRNEKGTMTVTPYGGFRYMKHEIGAELEITGANVNSAERSVDHNWTDIVIGTSLDVALAPKVHWSTSLDAGFGGSEGTFHVGTGVQWRFWKHMSIGPNFNFMALDYENGDPQDSDWYKYDASEFGAGISFLFHFQTGS